MELLKKESVGFSKSEDIILIQLIKILGNKNWKNITNYYSKISDMIYRNIHQLKSRWIDHLDPNPEKLNWDIIEEYIFFEFRIKLGNRWAPIAKFIPAKSDNDVKNHFHSNLKKILRKFLKKNFESSKLAIFKLKKDCIFEKIRAFYYVIYIKSKYKDIIHYYDPINNTIDFDGIKGNSDIITNIDDRAICDLVIDQKGSLIIINKYINELCLKILLDPSTIQLIEKLDEKYLIENIKNLDNFDIEEEENQTLIYMIFRLHVFYNLKSREENQKENYYENDTINSKRIPKNITKLLLRENENNQNKDILNSNTKVDKVEGEFLENENKEFIHISIKENEDIIFPPNKFCDNVMLKNNNNSIDKISCNRTEKDALIKDLKSTNFMEYNLNNIYENKNVENSIEKSKSNLNKTEIYLSNNYEKRKDFLMKNYLENPKYVNNDYLKNPEINSNNRVSSNLSIENIQPEEFINTDKLKKFQKQIPFSLNHDKSIKMMEKLPGIKNLQKVEFSEILEKFFESKELGCVLNHKDSPSSLKNFSKINEKKLINSNHAGFLDIKLKNLFRKKLNQYHNEEFTNRDILSYKFKQKLFNKTINIDREKQDCNQKIYKTIHQKNIDFNKEPANSDVEIKTPKNKISYTLPYLIMSNEKSNISLKEKELFKYQDSIEKKINDNIKYYNENVVFTKDNDRYKLLEEKYKQSDYEINSFKNIIKSKKKRYCYDERINSSENKKKFVCSNKETNDERYLIKNNQVNLNWNSLHKKEEKIINPEISIDLKEKCLSIEEDNLLNTNVCYISNSMLDKLMNLHDPDIFLKIIEKIVVNNIVFSIFNKDQYNHCFNSKFENDSNLKYIFSNNINKGNINDYNFGTQSSNYIKGNAKYTERSNSSEKENYQIKIAKNVIDNQIFNNLYDKIKNDHKINIKNYCRNKENSDNFNLNLDEKYLINNGNNIRNIYNEDVNNNISNSLNVLNKDSYNVFKKTNNSPNNYKNFYTKYTNLKLENIEENKSKLDDIYMDSEIGRNPCISSNYLDNLNAKLDLNSGKYENGSYKNLKVNNFNFFYNTKYYIL